MVWNVSLQQRHFYTTLPKLTPLLSTSDTCAEPLCTVESVPFNTQVVIRGDKPSDNPDGRYYTTNIPLAFLQY